MRLYESTLPDGSRRLVIHLDERKTIAKDDPRVESGELRAGQPDPEWCFEQVFGAVVDPPETGTRKGEGVGQMREMTVAEIGEQQEREAVALAREALAAKRATEEQEQAANSDPFADGGRKV